jgi:hypothetical protein
MQKAVSGISSTQITVIWTVERKYIETIIQEAEKAVASSHDLKDWSFHLSLHPKCQTFPSILHH